MKLTELTPYRKAVTKQTFADPEKQVYSWDVKYEPDFLKLVEDTSHLIREYHALVKKNNLENDTTISRNIRELEDFRINLIYLATVKYPELKDKIKPLFENVEDKYMFLRKVPFSALKGIVWEYITDERPHLTPKHDIYKAISQSLDLDHLAKTLTEYGYDGLFDILMAFKNHREKRS